jgi:hypothetical protein
MSVAISGKVEVTQDMVGDDFGIPAIVLGPAGLRVEGKGLGRHEDRTAGPKLSKICFVKENVITYLVVVLDGRRVGQFRKQVGHAEGLLKGMVEGFSVLGEGFSVLSQERHVARQRRAQAMLFRFFMSVSCFCTLN